MIGKSHVFSYQLPTPPMGELVVRVCKYCGNLRSICDKRRGDDLSHLECRFRRKLDAAYAEWVINE